ncbi:EpsG family protein [Flavobacterium ardleyense]|uniref:EpsG family protein n=1 Tax=Flavobacterium ardleyense TaxID=2038737 RepID=A0ABW5Z5C1_9FLAO
MIYIIIFLLIFFFLFVNKIKKNTEVEYLLLLIVFVSVAGFRYRVGGDSLAYENYFIDLPKFNELSDFDFTNAPYEFSWYLFNAISKIIDDSFVTFQILHALIINTVLFWFIRKYSQNKWLSLLLYFFINYLYFNMEILRESLAIATFLLAVPSLLQKKWIIYILLCLIACTFHSSAYITIVFPFLLRQWKGWQTLLIYLTITLVFAFFSPGEIFSSLNLGVNLEKKANLYISIQVTLLGFLSSLLKLLPFFWIYYLRKKNNISHYFDKLIYIYLMLGFMACFIGGFYRFQNYLSIVALIYVADSIILFQRNRSRNQYKIIGFQMMIYLMFANQILYFGRSTSEYEPGTHFYNRYYPYHTIADPKIDNKRERLFFNSMEKQ